MKNKLIFNKKISWYAIALEDDRKKINHYHKNGFKFFYPASAYKVFIASAILNDDNIDLNKDVIVPENNPITDLFPKDHLRDSMVGTKRSVSYFLDRMLKISDNRAADVLATLTDVDKFLKDKHYTDTGRTQRFKSGKKCMFVERIVSCAGDLAMFACNLENYNNDYYKEQMKKYLCGKDMPSVLKNSIWNKSGNMTAMSNKGPKFLRRLYDIKYKAEVAVIECNELKYAVAILTKCNVIKGSTAEIDLAKIQKQIERKLNKR